MSRIQAWLTIAGGLIAILGFFGIAQFTDLINSPAGPVPPGTTQNSPGAGIAPPVDAPPIPERPPTVPTEVIGSWSGYGLQYANDPYPQSLEVTFTSNGTYSKVTEGAARDDGRFVVSGSSITFMPRSGPPYTWQWERTGQSVLILQNEMRQYNLEQT
ncbi:hypothetical protein [Actinomycetospora straminea]|uniref:Lipocalin-like domain-containing protein n=1 Tax=Actinomycetospora straminea TaxID=663607 RepID=A0ABP9EIS4_9PSEU|nr:hypothetical protein [Actinomycetospora straminea]MDD7933755.1 hypothetical protein [Actinomycetospora straminea]